MKNLLLFSIVFIFCHSICAQNCDIKIEILPEQFMYGTIKEIPDKVDKTEVYFKDIVMEVLLSMNGKSYNFTVLNENCQAYCKKQKRVRQLNSGDEKLVKNLISDREEDILIQLKKCGV